MKLRYFAILSLGLLFAACQKSDSGDDISVKDPEDMTKAECQKVSELVYQNWLDDQKEKAEKNLSDMKITSSGNVMKFSVKTFGTKPSDGRSLWISLHGGGGTTESANNQQWENQKSLYTLSEGMYVCPRAPWNTWDMWFKEPIDVMFEELIRTMVIGYDVNPNKVFVMGYSAGGDGVWRLATRLTDHWAAAAMMAGHPGDVGLENVRNMPFTLWVGGNDTDYNRNVEVAKRGEILDQLQAADPQGYIHETHVLEGYPHWMNGKDKAAVPWMAKYTRNPYPKKIVWVQESVLRSTFYWVEAPKSELQKGKKVVLSIQNNSIVIEECDYSSLTLYLSDSMVDLDKEVDIQHPNGNVTTIKPKRSQSTLKSTISARGDKNYMFPVKVSLSKIEK